MTSAVVPRQVTPGAPRHGVVRYARELADAVGALVGRAVPLEDAAPAGAGPIHLHFTDRLWGVDPAAAAGRVERLAAAGAAFTVTLHDLPQVADGLRNLPRRADAYRRVARAARGVACSSGHEVALLRDVVGVDAACVVVPLPVTVHAALSTRPEPDDEVALLGFVYPGKGHADALAAVAALAAAGSPAAAGLGVTALGGAAAGHPDELERLEAEAGARGVRFAATGYLDEAALLWGCRRAAVPLAAHVHVSASGSIGSWIGAGRRPLVPDSPYTREIDLLRPGTVTRYHPGQLAHAIERARRSPASTWCAPGTTTRPDLADAAAAHLDWWSSGVAW